MKSGSPIRFDLALYDASGTGLSYADAAAFTTAGWSLSFIDMATGAAVSPSISYTLAPVAGVSGRHTVSLTLTTASWFLRITPPTVNHSFSVMPTAAWTGEATDTDSLYARINSIYGVTGSTSVPGLTLDPIVEGDSYKATLKVPTSYLSRMGWTDLTGATLTGTIRRPGDDGTGTAALTMTGTHLTVNGSDPTAIDMQWDSFPSGMVLTTPERANVSLTYRVEIQAVKTTKKLTVIYNAPFVCYRQDNTA